MKKSTLLLLLLLLITAVVSYFVVNNMSSKESSIDLSDRAFAVKDKENISRVRITKRSGTTNDFRKIGGRWKLNENIVVNKHNMDILLQTLAGVQIDHIPHPNANENIVNEIAKIGILVEVYTNDTDTPETSYYVGGSTIDEYGTYFLVKGKKQPYVCLLKGINGSIRSRFDFGENYYEDNAIFHEKIDEIQSIKVEYPQEKSSSFELYDLLDEPKIKSLYRLTEKEKPILKPRIDAYLQDFVGKHSEYNYFENAKKDSIKSLVPFADISFKTKKNEDKWIKLYALNEINMLKYSKQTLANQNRIERYYAITSDDRFMLVQRVNVGEWLRPYDYFVK